MHFSKRIAVASAVALASTLFAVISSGAGAGAQQEPDPCAELNPASVGALQQAEPLCSIGVEKTLASANPAQAGSTVSFNIVVTNTGEAPLTNVSLIDSYDPAFLDFVSASVTESDIDESVGVIFWEDLLPDPDDGSTGVWESGESRSISVSFRALQTPLAENCAVAAAEVALFIESLQEGPPEIGVESEISCDSVRIVQGGGGGGGGSRRPTATPTDEPDAPTPVSTVAPATVVPPAPPVGIAAPDTGTGDGVRGDSSGSIALVIATIAGIAGSVLLRRATR